MTTNGIPAEHLTKLQAATDAELDKVRQHNRTRADRDYAAGRYTEARRWYAYVDACQAILDERRYGPQATAVPTATQRQVDYIAKLLIERHRSGSDAGFSGVVNSLHTAGTPNLDAIRALTKTEASQVIDSLTENY